MPTQLTAEQARQLLAPLGEVTVARIQRAATTNDVFRVVTHEHGTYFFKFHTARWYADQPDTFFVAEREAAVCDLLATRGLPLPYRAWADTSRTVVSRSVFVCGELSGVPVTEAARAHPEEAEGIFTVLGHYFRRLHAIEFTNPGLLGPEHARVAPASGVVPHVATWDEHSMHHPGYLGRGAQDELARVAREELLPEEVITALRRAFSESVEVVRPEYTPPRFTVGNCHAYHFHVAGGAEGWGVLGCYDFEAASAGACSTDFVELEVTLTPSLGSASWRRPFFEACGEWPSLPGFVLRLSFYLLGDLGRRHSRLVPDPGWLAARWPALLAAERWEEVVWHPAQRPEARS